MAGMNSIEWWHVVLFLVFIIGAGVAIGIAGSDE